MCSERKQIHQARPFLEQDDAQEFIDNQREQPLMIRNPTDAELAQYKATINFSIFPKQWLADFEPKSADDKKKWYIGRWKCLKYHLYLSGFVEKENPEAAKLNLKPEYAPIMGMDFQSDPHDILFSRFIQKKPGEGIALTDLSPLKKKFMILWPRGLFKTSSIIVEMVQTILNYPNVRICFLTGGDKLAERQCERLKRVFEKPTPLFEYLFPEFCLVSVLNKKTHKYEDVNASMGTNHQFTVPCRTNETFAEPTFAISTAKTVKAGSHYDIIFIDDLVNEQNYRSVKALEKCYQDYIDICPVLEPTGYIIMTGTRYSYGDTYERIQEMAKEEERLIGRSIWQFSIRDCWSWGCKNCPHTSVYHDYDVNIQQPPCAIDGCPCIGFENNKSKGVLFPATRTHDGRSIGHTLEFLEGEKIRLGPEFFANQYENRPIASGAQTFDEVLLGRQTLHRLDQIPPYSQSFTFVVGDLAYVGQADRDNSVLLVCRMFQGQIFIYDCEFGNWDSGQVAEMTVNIILKHRPNMMYYEKFNGWEAYNTIISAHAKIKGLEKVPLQWLKGSQAANAKIIRIGSAKGPLTAKRLWFYAGMKGYQQIVQQLCKWPKLGRHDDFADCVGQVVAAPTGYQLEKPPTVASSMNWLRKLHPSEPEGGGNEPGNNDGSGFCM
jgi:hypothetical protein